MATGVPLLALRVFVVAAAAAAALSRCGVGEAAVHDYSGERFVVRGNAYVLHGGSEGLYASPTTSPGFDSNSDSLPGSSFIRFENITFRRPEEEAATTNRVGNVTNSSVTAIVFEVEDRDNIGGSAYGGQRALCCTPDLAKLGACIEGTVIYRCSSRNPDWPRVLSASFQGSDPEATLPLQTLPITETGMYNLYFVFCDPALDGLVIEGKTVWKNPHGYLPGKIVPLMKFYGFMYYVLLILGVFWFFQYARFWEEVMPLQNGITLVIVLGMFEITLLYVSYAEFNSTGVRPKGITFWAVTLVAVKRTMSRVLILIVSVGYGIVRPTLAGLTSRMALLGGTFFVASEVLELAENFGAASDVSGKPILLLSLSVAILDTFFIIWIFTSLSKTLCKLQAKRMTSKLDMYRKFINALIGAIVVSIAWIGFEIYFKSINTYGELWKISWIFPALWQIISFCLLCMICNLCAPSRNSMRYAYSDDGNEDIDREDTKSLLKPGPFSYKDSWSISVSPDPKTVQKSNATLSDDGATEEDKRE